MSYYNNLAGIVYFYFHNRSSDTSDYIQEGRKYLYFIFYIAALILYFAVSIFTLILAESSTDKILGQHDYLEYCADCHAQDGKGNGPKAKQLSKQPKDLTVLSKENGGSFPETAVYQIIDGRRIKTELDGVRVETAHGLNDMPNWGELFRALIALNSAK